MFVRIFIAFIVLSLSPVPLCAKQPVPPADVEPVVQLLELVLDADPETAKKCLDVIAGKIQSREIAGEQLKALRPRLVAALRDVKPTSPLHTEALLVRATLADPVGLRGAGELFATPKNDALRLQALQALVVSGDKQLLDSVATVFADKKQNSPAFRSAVLAALGRLDDPAVAPLVLARYGELEPDLQPKAVELLTQRPAWSKRLLEAIGQKQIPATALNANQVARLLASKDEELAKLVAAKWGSVRTERNPQREEIIAQTRDLLRKNSGNPHKGQEIFKRVCAQCHKIHGEGQEVGPDITLNGRSTYEQLLSNVLDPSLVIGVSYQARTVVTEEGRVLTGLPVEESEVRVVLKLPGGKVETIARGEIESIKISQLSLMPEDLEKQLKPGELEDLFAFLVLDKPPSDPSARKLPGAR